MKLIICNMFVIIMLFVSTFLYADDYDDGIGSSDGISTGDDDLKKMSNARFYNAKASAKVYNAMKKSKKGNNKLLQDNNEIGGGTNIASPVIKGPVHGDIIIQLDADDITVLQKN